MKTAGLSLDQAPPLWVPTVFFAMVPLACAVAGGLLLVHGAEPLNGPRTPASTALTHVGTLGIVTAAMLGAMYQLVPVAAGARVPAPRLAGAVAAAYALGAGTLIVGLATARPSAIGVGGALLAIATAVFAGPVGWALLQAPGRGPTVVGMRTAAAALAAVAVLGIVLAASRAGTIPPPPDWSAARQAHFGLALLVWVGGLVAAVSWTVVPMFYVAAEVPAKLRTAIAAGHVTSLIALPTVAFGAPHPGLLLAAAAPAIVASWGLHPAATLVSLKRRRRKRADPSLRAWQGAMTTALCLPLLGAAALVWPDPRLAVAIVWIAVWGWAALVIHGMLGRIVPFLVWFHRFSQRLGEPGVPSMKAMFPDRRLRTGLIAHGVTLVLGLLAIGTGWDLAGRAAGLGLLVTGLWLGAALGGVLRRR
ncbi:MAG: hypothetical protein GY898_31890 [Proteobacteria bacterium]|nr:hypothetical protein [Pseudomonadota bacterium]